MATVLTNAGLYVGGYELSPYFNSLQISGEVDTVDVTGFGASAREYAIGLKGVRFSGAGFWNAEATDYPLFDYWGDLDNVYTFAATNSTGGVAYFVRGCEASYGWGMPLGQAATVQFSGQTSTGPFVRGNILHRATGVTSTSSSTAQQLGAVTSGQRIFAAAHVFSIAGTSTPTITFKVQSDSASNFPSATDRLTFTAMTAIGGQWQEAGPSAIADDYWRVNYTISGSSPIFGFIVSFGILDDIL
jgi:hypothetical protein